MQMQSKQVISSVTLYGCKTANILIDKQVDDNLSMEMDSVEDREIEAQHTLIPDMACYQSLNVEGQITNISVGQSHVLFLTEQQKVLSIGSNQFGQRGAACQNALTASMIPNVENVVSISCGLYHSVCLDSRNNIFSWGRGAEGQLGLGEVEYQYEPCQVVTSKKRAIKTICCGGSHTLMLAEDGGVLACGDDSWGQLGTGGGNSLKLKPTEIEWFSENMVRVIQIEAGLEHSLFLSSDKQVYSCGNNLFNQCGIEGLSNINKPTPISVALEAGETIIKIHASMGTFSALQTSKGAIYVWGTGSWGHARKPTNILNICQFEGTNPTFTNLVMGDNYALLQDAQGYFVFGSQILPTLGSLQPLEKLKCEMFKTNTGLKLQLGYKMMVVIDKESIAPTSRKFSTPESKQIQKPITQQYLKYGHIRNQSNEPNEQLSSQHQTSLSSQKDTQYGQTQYPQPQPQIQPLTQAQIQTRSQQQSQPSQSQPSQPQQSQPQQSQPQQSQPQQSQPLKSQPLQLQSQLPEYQLSIPLPPKQQQAHLQSLSNQDQLLNHTDNLQKTLNNSLLEIQSLKKEIEFCKSQMKQKDLLIVELQNSVQKHQNSRQIVKEDPAAQKVELYRFRQSSFSEVLENILTLPAYKKDVVQKVEKRPYQCCEPQTTPDSKKQATYVPQKVTTSDTKYLYEPHQDVKRVSETRRSSQQPTEHNNNNHGEQRRPSLYSHEKQEPLKVSNLDVRKYHQEPPKKKLGIQRQNNVNNFEYKTYEKLRLVDGSSSNKKSEDHSETRIKKIDESQFSLSRYNMKSIRSITPYDRPSDMYATQNSEQRRSIGSDVQAFNFERSVTPETSVKLLTDYSHKRTLTNNDKYGARERSGFAHDTKSPKINNTSIVDKISNYQRMMVVTKPLNQNQEQSKYIFEDRYILSGNSPFAKSTNYDIDQYKSVGYTPSESSGMQYEGGHYKQYEDFYKLRG